MELISTIVNNIKAKHIMNNSIIKVCKVHNLFNVLKLMKKNKQNAVIVIDNSNRKHIRDLLLTIEDLVNIISEGITLEEYIDKNTATYHRGIDIEDSVNEIMKLVKEGYDKSIPVYSEGRIKGVISPNNVAIFFNNLLFKVNDLFSKILDNIHDAICVVDKEANVLIWNKSAEKLYKISREEIYCKKIQEIFPSALLPKVVAEGNSYENIFNSPRKGCYNIISAKPLMDNDQIIGGVSCDKDISELIRMAGLLSKTQANLQVLESEVSSLNESRFPFSQIVSNNNKFNEIIEFSKNISKSTINVLITGESGTGKEVFARAIHIESGRKGYFVPINCSAIPNELMESELFGYKGGAFTGSSREGRAGKFELAHNGTIFLDEIGDMPLNMQPKILRVIEDGIITRIGSENFTKIDVRIIAATNKNLLKLMDKGLFRKDLYYRLNSVLIELPPLRERREDIPLLVNKFIKDFCISYGTNIIEIPPDVMNILLNHHWEGNIRELRNLIERIVILSKHNKFDISYLPNDIIKNYQVSSMIQAKDNIDLSEVVNNKEKELILKALKITNNNKRKAAEILNIPRSTLYFKMNKYNIEL
ncbi:Signal-transduction and transcriptional-control protein [Proteiniborus sp. DW1]|uniref:sigma 54-interacting transcriptional regulator n=1 Tax=Proteiniborus sp. DW1 TaxID=1889883 RepID=UPI00092DF806|nr:sigma 54-interacting transcriptional regulator [Proteiniborus sp. DW1]SCG83382.1 Signal-transduction and transcriptional-control protein [Proteiniborus sp. DW1]